MGVLACDCEVYEICPSCAPTLEHYEKAAAAYAAPVTTSKGIEPDELLRQVQEMADVGSTQKFGDTVERLWAIVDHIEGNLVEPRPEVE